MALSLSVVQIARWFGLRRGRGGRGLSRSTKGVSFSRGSRPCAKGIVVVPPPKMWHLVSVSFFDLTVSRYSCSPCPCTQFDADNDGLLAEKEWRAYVKASTTTLLR